MAYATLADMLQQEGDDAVYAAFDRDRDQVIEEAAANDALDNGAAVIDSYLSQRYDLPLQTPPRWAKRINIDLALYFGSRGADVLTRELRQRYEDDLAFLKSVSTGAIGLGVATAQQPAGADDGLVKGEILVESEYRLFNRRTQQP